MKKKSICHQFIILTSVFIVFWITCANIFTYFVNGEVKHLTNEVRCLGSKSFFHIDEKEFSNDTFKLRANELVNNKFLAPYSLGIVVIDKNDKIIEKNCGRFGLNNEMVDTSFLSKEERNSSERIIKTVDSRSTKILTGNRRIFNCILPNRVMVYVDKITDPTNRENYLGEVWYIFPLKYSDSILILINVIILLLGILLISTALFLSRFNNKKTETKPLSNTN